MLLPSKVKSTVYHIIILETLFVPESNYWCCASATRKDLQIWIRYQCKKICKHSRISKTQISQMPSYLLKVQANPQVETGHYEIKYKNDGVDCVVFKVPRKRGKPHFAKAICDPCYPLICKLESKWHFLKSNRTNFMHQRSMINPNQSTFMHYFKLDFLQCVHLAQRATATSASVNQSMASNLTLFKIVATMRR